MDRDKTLCDMIFALKSADKALRTHSCPGYETWPTHIYRNVSPHQMANGSWPLCCYCAGLQTTNCVGMAGIGTAPFHPVMALS